MILCVYRGEYIGYARVTADGEVFLGRGSDYDEVDDESDDDEEQRPPLAVAASSPALLPPRKRISSR